MLFGLLEALRLIEFDLLGGREVAARLITEWLDKAKSHRPPKSGTGDD